MKTLHAQPGYCILVATETETEQTQSGLYVPETARENQHMLFGKVVSFGGWVQNDHYHGDIAEGDVVATFKNKAAKFTHDRVEHYLVLVPDILFVLSE